MKTDALFEVWPYVALAIAVGGLVVRYLLVRRRIDAIANELAHAKAVFLGGRAWRITLVLLFLTHAAAIAVPSTILLWNSVPLRLYALEATGFLLGAMAIGAWAEVMWRHMARPCASVRDAVGDAVLLGLVLVALASGLFMQGLYRWGSSWGAVTLTPYLVSLVRGRAAVDLVSQMPFLVRLHVVSAFGVLAVFPFSRLASLLVVALHRGTVRLFVPLTSGLDAAEARIRQRAAEWIWPEEDTDPDLEPPEGWLRNHSGIVEAVAPSLLGRNSGDAAELYETVSKAR